MIVDGAREPIETIDRWLHDPAPPERLAVIRIAVGAYALVYLIASVGEFDRLAGRSATEFDPVALAGVLDGPIPAPALWSLFAISIASGTLFTVGRHYRLAGPVFALTMLAWATYHSSWGQMLHFEHLVTLHLGVLAFSPAAAAFSLDARRSRAQPASARYGWPIRLLAIITVTTYAIAGFAKLRVSGTAWIDGTTLANHIGYSATRLDLLGEPRPPLAATVINHRWLWRPMSIGGLAVELLAPLALLTRCRGVWVAGVALFHFGTLVTMLVFFPYNGLGLALLPLYRVERLVPERWFRTAGAGRQLADPR